MMEIFLDEVNKSIEGEFDLYFKFIQKIASGGFGTVIRAIYYELDREVAVKVIDKTKHKFKNINRLKFEINILKQLKHKNIVEFLGCIETNSNMYIITEYCHDGTLRDLIDCRQKIEKKFTEEEVSLIMSNLVNAVDYIHSREIVHRDIKPENILFNDYNDLSCLKLVDFGLSTQFFEALGDFEFCGTLLYMAPEQIEKKLYTKSIDIWSCGIIMYILIHNGIHPFYNKGETSTNFLDKLKLGKWSCSVKISKMGLFLLQKLIEQNTSKRYTADKILKHPWITRIKNDSIPMTYLETMRVRTLRKKMIIFFGSVLFLNNCKKKIEEKNYERSIVSITQNINFNNPFIKKKVMLNGKFDSANSEAHEIQNVDYLYVNKNQKENNEELRIYMINVENINKILDDIFLKEREKCLSVCDFDNKLSEINGKIEPISNNFFQKELYCNIKNGDSILKKSLVKSKIKLKIIKESLGNKLYNGNNSEISSYNKNEKYIFSINTSFKTQDCSPFKMSRIKEYSEKSLVKTKSIIEHVTNSPEIKRKKFDYEVPEFKLDFKSN